MRHPERLGRVAVDRPTRRTRIVPLLLAVSVSAWLAVVTAASTLAAPPVATHVRKSGGGGLRVGNVGGAANVLAAVTTASHADTDTAKSNRTTRVIRTGRSNAVARLEHSCCVISLSPVRLDVGGMPYKARLRTHLVGW